ncbi:MAG: M50 family metallopeptidase [Nocardioidaceae bacterium]
MTVLVYTLGVVLFFLGVLASIALHEVGHMWPAKTFGVKVTQYFVGFGRTVWSTRRGDTEYGIKAIPMGGYIKMVGMLPPAKLDENGKPKGFSGGVLGQLIADARAAEYQHVTDADKDRLFYTRPWWQKVIVMSGGPMMNVLIAVVLLSAVFMGIGTKEPNLVVSQVSDCVIRASEGIRPCEKGDQVAPARAAGFQVGDELVMLNGEPIKDWDSFSADIRAIRGAEATVVVERDGEWVTLNATTIISERPSLTDENTYVDVGFLGITPDENYVRQDAGFVASTIGDMTQRTGQALVHMPERMWGVTKAAFLVDDREQESPMSVVGASRVAGEVASNEEIEVLDKWAGLLTLLGVVNLFVALFNFIPLLPLDGGHIAGALYEAIRRGIARVRGRPDPGYADVAQLLPIAYVAATVLIVMGAILVWADIVNPIKLTG